MIMLKLCMSQQVEWRKYCRLKRLQVDGKRKQLQLLKKLQILITVKHHSLEDSY